MKSIYTITLFVMLSFSVFGQKAINEIEKDTALANQYYTQAIQIADEKDQQETCLNLLQQAITLYEGHSYQEELTEIQGYYALQLSLQGKLEEAELMAKKAIRIVETQKISTSTLAFSYCTLQKIYVNKNLETAITYGNKALALMNESSKDYYQVILHLTNSHRELGNFKAVDSLRQQLEKVIAENAPNLNQYQVYLDYVQMTYLFETKNYEKALLYSEKVFLSNEKTPILDAKTLSSMYVTVGYTYSDMRQYGEALKWMNRGIESSGISKESPAYGNLTGNLGWIYKESGEYPKAIEYYQKAVQSFLKDEENYAEALSSAYGNLAVVYMQSEEYDKAIESIENSRKYGTQTFHDYVLGTIYFEKGDFEKSVATYHRSLLQFCTQFSDTNYFKNPSIYEVYTNNQYAQLILFFKGRSYFHLGQAKKDVEKMKIGLNLLEQSVRLKELEWERAKGFDVSKYHTNFDILRILGRYIDGYQSIYKLTPTVEAFNEILKRTQKRKAIQLMETLTPSLLPNAVFEEEQRLLKEVQLTGQQLDLAKSGNNTDTILFYQNQLLEINQQLENHISETNKKYPKESNHFYHTEYATLAEIQTMLPDDALLISYNQYQPTGEGECLILTIGKNTHQLTEINTDGLTDKVKRLNQLVQDRFAFQTPIRNEFIKISHELYNMLIQPIEKELERKTRLMLVVEGDLFHLPFELLLPNNDQKPYNQLDYLIKKYEINYNYSATAFLKLQEKQTVRDKSFFAFAPVFNKGKELNVATRSLDFMIDSLYRGFDKGEFTSLPSTKKETTSIAKIIKSNGGKTNVLLQKKATKTNFNQQIDQQPYQFVHIATHSFVNFKSPKLSAFACYATNETMDNLMYANEIQFKNINADLVVLSSCESGIGQLVAGEGLIALNRSFIYSGAKNVLFSLWKVSDKYSSDLMIDFYEAYFENTENPSYTTALRQAKLKMIANPKSAAPKYWSAFVLMGQ